MCSYLPKWLNFPKSVHTGEWSALQQLKIELVRVLRSDPCCQKCDSYFNLFSQVEVIVTLVKMGNLRSLFCLFSSFQTNISIFSTIKCEKMSILVLGFEPITFRTLVFSLNQQLKGSRPSDTSFYHPNCFIIL